MENKRFLTIFLCLAVAVSAQGYTPEYDQNGRLSFLKADLNRDGYFNMVDISLFASAWLEQDCGLFNPCSGADVYPTGGDSVIDLRDFAVTAEDYGRCTDPNNPDCIHVPLTLFEPPSVSDVLFALLGGEPIPPLGPAHTKDHYGHSGPGGGGAAGIHTIGRRYGALIPSGGHLGGALVIPRPGGGGGSGYVFYDARHTGFANRSHRLLPGEGRIFAAMQVPAAAGGSGFLDELGALAGGGEGSGDIFDNERNFQMAGNLVLTSEPDASGLLGSSNSPYWSYGGYATGLTGGGYTIALEPMPVVPPYSYTQPPMTGHSKTHPHLWGSSGGGSYGTYGNQGAKPLVPGGGGGESGLGGNRRTLAVAYIEFSSSSWARRPASDFVPSYTRINEPKEFVEPAGEVAESLISLPEKGSGSKLNLFSGEVCESAVDLHIASRGPDFVWQRIYRSRTGPNTVMGNRWDHSYNIYIEQDSSKLVVHNGCGRRDPYFPEPNGIWAADGFFRELAQGDDLSFIMTFPHKGTWKFHPLNEPNAPGKVSAITDRNGNSLTFDYDSFGRLATIHDALHNDENNRDITIAYNTGGFIESVTDFSGRQVKYEYYTVGEPNGSPGDLKSVTSPAVTGTPTGNDFPDGKTTVYTYSKGFADERLNHNLLTITDPKGQRYLQNTYGTDPAELSFDHVVRQIAGEPNDIIDITYMQQVPDANNSYAVTRIVTNDRVGNVKEHFFSNRNELLIVREYTGRADPNLPTNIDPNVNAPTGKLRADDPAYFETKFEYNKDSLLTGAAYPNGNERQFDYDETNTSPRSRCNLREIHYFAGSLEAVSDQNEIVHLFEYDPNFNFVTRYVDARGNETLCDYDLNGNRTRAEHLRPAESSIIRQWQYNEYGQVTAHVLPPDAGGHRRRDTYAYYSNPGDPNYGYLKNSIADANNLALTTSFEYDDVGNLTRITDPNGNDTQFIVNQLNQVVQIIKPRGDSGVPPYWMEEIFYDENNYISYFNVRDINDRGILQPDPNLATTYEYDILNCVTRVTREVDTTKTVRTEFEYDGNHNLTLIRSGEATSGSEPNNVIRYLYDERGLVFQTVRAPSDPNQSSTQYDYDGNGNLKKVSRGLEDTPHVSSFQHDGFSRMVGANEPMGNVAEYHYDAGGNLISKRFEGELVDMPSGADNVRLYESSYEYDSLNRLIRSVTAHFDPNTQAPIGDGNSITQFFYNDNSQLTRVVDDNGNETHYDYDTAGRLNLVTDAKDNTTAYSYDENSNITALTAVEKSDLDEPNETFVTTYQYDNLDRLIRVIDNNDNTTDFAYDSRSNCTRITNALNNETRYEYDGLNRLIRTVRDMDGDGADPGDANDIVTSQTWDDNSRLVTQTDDNGNTTTYEYDAVNHYVKTSFADDTETRLAHDVHHGVSQTTDAAGTVVDYTCDLLKRLTAKTITPGSGVSSDTTFENYKYDGMSRVVYAEDDDSVVTLTYDSLSNITAETLNGQTTTSVHDGLGNRLSCTYPGGRIITCTYDELNRKKVIAADGTAISTYSYIGPGRVRRSEYGNGTQCDYSHDSVKRIIGTTHSVDRTIIDERTYSWDEMYNKTQRKDIRAGSPEWTHDYTYDAIDRLIQTTVSNAVAVVRETDYSLDGVGNRTEVTGSPDPGSYAMDSNTPEPADFQMNQYTTTPFDSRLYDDNGNLVTIDSGETEQKDIIYDYRNQVVEVNDTSAGQIHAYAYDALGRRIEKIVDSNGSPQTTRYFYDGFQVIEEQDEDGDTLATYVYGHYIDEVLNMQRGSEVYYYHTDELYSVMAVTDDSASVVERYEYQDYGEPNFFDSSGGSIGASAIGNPYLFTGRRYDLETGWYNYGNRYFDSTTGRFITRDNSVIIPPIWLRPIPTGSMQAMMLQNRISRLNRVLTLLSNTMKRHHDTAMGIINNLK